VASGATGEAVAVEETVVSKQDEAGSWDAYVAAHGAALGVVSRRIAERIAALAAP
jgi:hypothetical protein